MEHQDFKPVTIGKPVSLNSLPKIVPKNTTDMHKIKIENETENFNVVKFHQVYQRLQMHVLRKIDSERSI